MKHEEPAIGMFFSWLLRSASSSTYFPADRIAGAVSRIKTPLTEFGNGLADGIVRSGASREMSGSRRGRSTPWSRRNGTISREFQQCRGRVVGPEILAPHRIPIGRSSTSKKSGRRHGLETLSVRRSRRKPSIRARASPCFDKYFP